MPARLIRRLHNLIQRIRAITLTGRQSVLIFVISMTVLIGLMVLWLGASTRTALLAAELDTLDARRAELTDEINRAWLDIANVTSPLVMRQRAQQSGFQPAARVEFLSRPADETEARRDP